MGQGMFPPGSGFSLDIAAISGISGAVSIACWVVVFSPQIIENFRRSSAEGLSIEFIIIWLAGDLANIVGAILQKVLPTMIILAIYYTLADIVLLGQCFYYRGFTFRDPKPSLPIHTDEDDERTGLLQVHSNAITDDPLSPTSVVPNGTRSNSIAAVSERIANAGHHLSPATPLHDNTSKPLSSADHDNDEDGIRSPTARRSRSALWKTALFNLTAILVVVAAGVAGYFLSPSWSSADDEHSQTPSQRRKHEQDTMLHFNVTGQVFGYLCAVLYLGSRVPQLLLNYRRKSTEGLNALFFLFACLGNLTFVLSILAFEAQCVRHGRRHVGEERSGLLLGAGVGGQEEAACRPGEARDVYARYILVNTSWLIGSLGVLLLDFTIFVQFILYNGNQTS